MNAPWLAVLLVAAAAAVADGGAASTAAAASAHTSAPVWQTLPTPRSLPPLTSQGHVTHEGASIWYGTVGEGAPVILLHGGLTSADSWGNQVPLLVEHHHRVILIDSRGHGRSTLGSRPLGYELMETDVIAVMDQLHIEKADFVGWSDGGIISLIVAMKHPARASAIFAFGANMDKNAVNPDAFTAPILKDLEKKLSADYARLSATPNGFGALNAAVETMQKTEPNYGAPDLSVIKGPRIAIADADHEEFVPRAHTVYLAHTIPGAKLIFIHGGSHFSPWQVPDEFNRAMLEFLQSGH